MKDSINTQYDDQYQVEENHQNSLTLHYNRTIEDNENNH